jgi:hypothetical protein
MKSFAFLLLAAVLLTAAEHRGVVRFGTLPLPGASVTLKQGGKKLNAVTDAQGNYSIANVTAEPFTVDVDMQLFAPLHKEFKDTETPSEWDLELLTAEQIAAKAVRQPAMAFQRSAVTATPAPARPDSAPAPPPPDPEIAQRAADGLLINGSVNNGAASPFSQSAAFGNNRRGTRSLYNGSLGVILNNSAFDARSYSLTGQNTLLPQYSRVQGVFAFGGPIKTPWILKRNGPTFTVNYQWTRNSNATSQTGLVPTTAERAGQFAQAISDPLNGGVFAGNTIPASRMSQQARALLRLYPDANFGGSSRYNFQAPIVTSLHQDDLQARGSKSVKRNSFTASFAFSSTRSATPGLLGFLETSRSRNMNATAGYRRSLTPRTFINTTVNFSRSRTRAVPYYSQRENISGSAGITGNNQEAVNWGPPNLIFSNGLTPLMMSQASLIRNQTSGVAADLFTSRGRHNAQVGVNIRRQQFNVVSQQDARGTFTFTGASTCPAPPNPADASNTCPAQPNDLEGFLLGLPDAASIAFGNADKYLRANIIESFVNDDWRVNSSLTINAGVRWEYWSPVSEKYGRLVNLNISPDFKSIAPNSALPNPDRNNMAPRLAFSWRPFAATSLIVRGGYGIYYDTAIYQPIAMEMAQQAPLSKSLRISNSAATPLTLANGFSSSGTTSPTTFAVDPNFRTGYTHTWQLSLQRDLPFGMQMNASYNGGKGSDAQQKLLPNTFPTAAVTPSGYTYLTSNGSSVRHAGVFQLRRRLRNGFTAQAQYTFSKSLDNALLGGRGRIMTAQNWLDLDSERGRSSFDQRHLLSTSVQYTTGLKLRGWAALLFKEWTVGAQITAGSGLPLSPVFAGTIPGTGVTGVLRPDYTGASLYDAPQGLNLNPAAYAKPAAGKWGNAGRNSINGPGQFGVNSTIGRTFRGTDRITMDLRVDAANATNTPTFPSWNTVYGNSQFGLPNAANQMRSVQATFRMRF